MGRIDSFYIQDYQRLALSEFLNNSNVDVLQIGVTPTAILIWLPFIGLSFLSNEIANTIWISTSILVLGIAISKSLMLAKHKGRKNLIIYLSFITIILTSYSFVFSIFLGQTNILMCGIFLAIILHLNNCTKTKSRHNSIFILIALFIASIKVPYFIACVLILLIYSVYKESILSIFLILIYAVFTDVVLDYNLFIDWSKQLSTYLAEESQGYLFLLKFVTLRSVLSGFIDDYISLFLTKILTAMAYVFLFVAAICKSLKLSNNFKWPQNEFLITLIFFSNLMLLPYSGFYEDILIILPLYMALINFTDCEFPKLFYAITMTTSFLYFNYKLIPYEFSVLSLWLLKLSIFILIILFNHAGYQKANSETGRATI
jgi:hypothetical protein